MKHTKVDWRTVYEIGKGSLVKSGDKTIAKVFRNNNILEINANARLLAAAPELLESLEVTLKFLKPRSDSNDLTIAERVLFEKIEEAIKKATGDEKD